MHQSWISRIQLKYMFSYCLGTNWISPLSTTAMAFSASGLVLTYHWSVSHGSMMVPERSPFGTFRAWASMLSKQASGLEGGNDLLARLETIQAGVCGRQAAVESRC